MDEAAQQAGVSRTTLYHLERGEIAHPRVTTLHKLARLYGISPTRLQSELPSLSPDAAVPNEAGTSAGETALADWRMLDRATNPAVAELAESEPALFLGWQQSDWDEMFSTFATGGALRPAGVRRTAEKINRKRAAVEQLQVVLETHLAEAAATMIEGLYQLVIAPPAVPTDEQSPLA